MTAPFRTILIVPGLLDDVERRRIARRRRHVDRAERPRTTGANESVRRGRARRRAARDRGERERRRAGPARRLDARSTEAPDVEHAARRVVVRVPLGKRDPAVDDDRAVPVAAARRRAWRRSAPVVGRVDVRAAARVVHPEQPAGDDRARAAACRCASAGASRPFRKRPRRRAAVVARRTSTSPSRVPDGGRGEEVGARRRRRRSGARRPCARAAPAHRVRARAGGCLPSLPPCATSRRARSTGDVEPRSTSPALSSAGVRRRVVAEQLRRVGGEHERRVAPVRAAVPRGVARRDEQLAGRRIDDGARAAPDRRVARAAARRHDQRVPVGAERVPDVRAPCRSRARSSRRGPGTAARRRCSRRSSRSRGRPRS